jgi:chromosome segregation ATPase
MMERAVRFIHKEPTIWGPIFLISSVAIGVKTAIPFDLLFIAATGFLLCAHLKLRGCVYSLILLGLAAVVKHAFVVSDHLWQLGLEGSLACAFFMTAWAFEQGASWIQSLQSQMLIREAAVDNLEEELAKTKESTQEQQILFQEKVAAVQKELEDLQTEYSSILILNEVLRKTTARHTQENETLTAKVLELYKDKEMLKADYEECQKDLARLKNDDSLVLQNTQLMKELNVARYEKEQTHLINETIARLYARENLKAKEADQEAESLTDQLRATRKEMARIAQPLEEKLAASEKQISGLAFEFEKANQEANQARSQLLKLNEIVAERNFLKERLAASHEEITLLQNQKPAQDPHLAEQLAFAQERMLHLSQIEPLFKQLKKQFEEKDQVLHQARTDLFKIDTELQKLQIEKAALEFNPIPKEVEEELQQLSAQIIELEEENRELQELISILNENPTDAAKRKKKLKTTSSSDQDYLF